MGGGRGGNGRAGKGGNQGNRRWVEERRHFAVSAAGGGRRVRHGAGRSVKCRVNGVADRAHRAP